MNVPRKQVVKSAQLLLQRESPALVTDGLWGPNTDRAYVGASAPLRDEVKSSVSSSGWDLDDLRPKRVTTMSTTEQTVAEAAIAAGIVGKSLVNFLAVLKAESNFRVAKESHYYRSLESVRKANLHAFDAYSEQQLASLVSKGPEAFFEEAYGWKTDIGRRLGNTAPGDGGKYYGRGLIQITGRYNYERMQRETGLPVADRPEILVKDLNHAIQSSIWYWKAVVGSAANDIRTASARVNKYMSASEYAKRARYAEAYAAILA